MSLREFLNNFQSDRSMIEAFCEYEPFKYLKILNFFFFQIADFADFNKLGFLNKLIICIIINKANIIFQKKKK